MRLKDPKEVSFTYIIGFLDLTLKSSKASTLTSYFMNLVLTPIIARGARLIICLESLKAALKQSDLNL